MRLNVFERGRTVRDLKDVHALRSKQPILDRIDGIDKNLAIAALTNDAKSPKPEVRSWASAMLREITAGAAAVLLLVAPVNSHANQANGKATIVQVDKDVADKAFETATRQLGELSDELKAALAKVKEMVVAVITGKPIKVEQEEECEIGCLRKKKEIDPITGELVEEEARSIPEYQFSVGNARTARRFANTLRSGLNGTKDVVVTVEGDTITVKNTNNRREIIFADNK